MATRKPHRTPAEPAAENEPGDEGVGAPIPGFPVVGMGASAGGLGAFEAFLSAVPEQTKPGMAFVLVQHLAPNHKSLLAELVKHFTWMPVFEVQDGMVVAPDCVYVIPPHHDLAFLDGRLQLVEQLNPRSQRLAIDYFFESLARGLGDRAIAIVLSGTGSDGTAGVRAIKAEGGMAMAQLPESTEFESMPQSVITAGLADYILRPELMPAQLQAYAAKALGKAGLASPLRDSGSHSTLKRIFPILRALTGHDFSSYKQNTIVRRVERRMAVHQLAALADYVQLLERDPKEVEALFRDLLIGVTRFFRDPEAFTALQEKVIPPLFAGKSQGSLVRVWVPGCSTGEEAYSFAILLLEHMASQKHAVKLQVFATDLDRQAIFHARAGVYPASIAGDVSPDRLQRFFTQEPGGGYRVHKELRDLLIFSEQDLVRDPPLSRLDLISCRNLLIYLGADLQKKLMTLFHYALVPGGCLFLGSSETIGGCCTNCGCTRSNWKCRTTSFAEARTHWRPRGRAISISMIWPRSAIARSASRG